MKAIVTTTINKPTKALLRFREKRDWILIVVGDKRTPHDDYQSMEGIVYLDPDIQQKRYPELSKAIGWNCIQRRSIGYIEAIHLGADVVASVDDDNIPTSDWGESLLLGQKVKVTSFHTKHQVFDPLSPFGVPFWHRGYPINLIKQRCDWKIKETEITVQVQASLWNGNPDIDAIARIAYDDPAVTLPNKDPYTSNALMPFNSQNTFFTRKAIKDYFLFPHVGRMDDIWGAYVYQFYNPNTVVFTRPTVYQERNPHDFVKDLEAEMLGYRRTMTLVENLEKWFKVIPKESHDAYRAYRRSIK